MTKEKQVDKQQIEKSPEDFFPVKTKCFFDLRCSCSEQYSPVWARLSGIGVLNGSLVEVWRPLRETLCEKCGKALPEFYDGIVNKTLLSTIMRGESSLSLPMRKQEKEQAPQEEPIEEDEAAPEEK